MTVSVWELAKLRNLATGSHMMMRMELALLWMDVRTTALMIVKPVGQVSHHVEKEKVWYFCNNICY